MLVRLLIALVCLGLAVRASLDEAAPKVKTPLGRLKGYYKVSQNGRKYEAYEGVPYAMPPVGKLRFKVNITRRYAWKAAHYYGPFSVGEIANFTRRNFPLETAR